MTSPAFDIPDFSHVQRAAQRLKGAAHRTPVMTSRMADERTGATLFFKCEQFQRAGAFKFRGAYNAISALGAEERKRGVVAFSSGNHAQAIALAGQLLSVPRVIIMPQDAPALKVAATRGYGAEVIHYDRYTEDREAIGKKLAAERGLTLLPPYDHPEIIAGQGTAALELIEEVGPLDLLLVCLGGGGLLSGSALSARARSPDCRVIGVEPEASNDGKQSLAAGKVIRIPQPRSIADGAMTTHLGNITFDIIKREVAEIVTVSDEQLIGAMRFFMERMKLVVEPTGCLGAAALFNGIVPAKGKRVGVIISGGNVDPAAYARFVGG